MTEGLGTRERLLAEFERVRKAVKQVRDKRGHISELTTRTALINPILEALGWDSTDLDEVVLEYRHKPQDNPVDYALFLHRSPCLFVEAKPLDTDLDDHKWKSQTVNYANAAGVEWCVLTDGDKYCIYNAHAPVDVDQKLFRTAVISDTTQESATLDTLELLSKQKLSGDILRVLWRAYSVDRSVHAALDAVLHGEDAGLIRLIKRRNPELTSAQIRDSLKRADITVNFPALPPISPPLDDRTTVSVKAKPAERYALRKQFWAELLPRAKEKTPLHAASSPRERAYVAVGTGIRGLSLVYVIAQHSARVELYIDRGDRGENTRIFETLAAAKDQIEAAFGGALVWEPLPGKRACRISYRLEAGGYRDDRKRWPEIHDAMIGAMIRLEKALRPHLDRLPAASRKGAGQKAAAVRKSIRGFVLLGERYAATSWANMFVQVCGQMYRRHPSDFRRVLAMGTAKQKWFSTNPADLLRPAQVPGTDIYVYTNLSAAECLRRSRSLMEFFGHDPGDLTVDAD